MNEKTKLRVIQILCVLSLIMTVFSIQRTYARYFEKVDTVYTTNIKRWFINLNGTDIHGKEQELSAIMQPTFISNENMNDNDTLVPGREGYFEFVIDYSKVDLAFKYDFYIEQLDQENLLEDFEIYGYSIIQGDTKTTKVLEQPNNFSELTQIIRPETEENKTKTIRILFRWNDDNSNKMDNSQDTQYKGETVEGDSVHTALRYRVKVTFTQYLENVNKTEG